MVTYPGGAAHATPRSTREQDRREELQGLETKEPIPETDFLLCRSDPACMYLTVREAKASKLKS